MTTTSDLDIAAGVYRSGEMSPGLVSEVRHTHRALRSICAVLAGALTGGVLSIGTDMLLYASGVFPPLGQPIADSLLLLATIYRTVYGIAGSYLTARLAPDRPMMHALTLGVMGLIANIMGAVAAWNKGPAFGHAWYPLALHRARPAVCLGGRLAPRIAIARLFMVLTKDELITALQHEVRVLLHLASKVDAAMLDYRPTAKQRSLLELLQYLVIMGPIHARAVAAGEVDLDVWRQMWRTEEPIAKAMNLEDVKGPSANSLRCSPAGVR